jgi:hypothetical protein
MNTFINSSCLENYVYGGNNEIGGFPIKKYLKKEEDYEKIGGGKSKEQEDFARFDNLVIPIGLVCYSNSLTGSQLSATKMNKSIDILPDDIFDSLFFSLAKHKPIPKTKKILPEVENKTKKQRG